MSLADSILGPGVKERRFGKYLTIRRMDVPVEKPGFTATRNCDSCGAESPACEPTWKFWRLDRLAIQAAVDAGWVHVDGRDACTECL